MDDFLQKLKKVVRVVLYGPAISQSDCRKAGPYHLPYNNTLYLRVRNKIKVHSNPDSKLKLSVKRKLEEEPKIK